MNRLSTLQTLLIVLFVLFVVAVIAELCYVLWCRRRFWQQNPSSGDPEFPGDPFSTTASAAPSKELLYFLCLKSQSRIEPALAPALPSACALPLANGQTEATDVLKWQGLYGPSRVLFTINEEEREDMESDKCSSAEKESKSKSVSLEECFDDMAGSSPEVTLTLGVYEEESVDETTPFTTPCASPPYYTPPPSPTRGAENTIGNRTDSPEKDNTGVFGVELVGGNSPEGGVSGNDEVSFVNQEAQGE